MNKISAGAGKSDLISWIAGGLLAALIIMAGLLIIQVWQETETGRQNDTGQAGSAVLIIHSNPLQAGSLSILRSSLANFGYTSRTLRGSDDGRQEEQLADAINDLAVSAAIAPDDVWLLFTYMPDAWLWQQAIAADCAGVAFVTTEKLALLLPDDNQSWPDTRPIAWFYGLADIKADKNSARMIFESYTGEDASLYPGSPGGRLGSAESYRSADGTFLLAFYPGLPETLLFLAPGLISDLIMTLSAWQYEDIGDIPARPMIISYFLPLYLRLLLTALIIICLPSLLMVLLRKNLPLEKTLPAGRKLLSEFFFWFPGILVATALAVLFTSIGGNRQVFLISLMIMLPAADGWFRLSVSQVNYGRGGERAAGRSIHPGRKQIAVRPAEPGNKFAIFVLILLILLFYLWRYLIYGWYGPPSLPLHIFAVLCLFSAACGFNPAINSEAANWRLTLIRHWPFMGLLIFSLFSGRREMIISALLVLLASFWSAGVGKVVSAATGSPFAGSMARSLFMISVWTLPPVLQGLIMVSFV